MSSETLCNSDVVSVLARKLRGCTIVVGASDIICSAGDGRAELRRESDGLEERQLCNSTLDLGKVFNCSRLWGSR